MFDVGRLCVKTAGRDAMQYCAIVEVVDDKMVLVDGNTRRKKVNRSHLEPLPLVLDIKKGAQRDTITTEFEKHELPIKVKGESRSPKSKEQQKENQGFKKTSKKGAESKKTASKKSSSKEE
jgi:large subunit ribosomal protein L14e